MESQQRLKNLTPSLLWGDLAARATLGETHMMDSRLRFKNYFGHGESFLLIFGYGFGGPKFRHPATSRVAVVSRHIAA
jgi:hypothetical protein